MNTAALLCVALLLDAALGEPEALWRRVPHPVALMGRAITWFDQRWNDGALGRQKGALALALMVAAVAALGAVLAALPLGGLWEVLLGAVLIAQRSLVAHVRAVGEGLAASLEAGRRAVSMIVGRETADLDEAGVARAAIESAAENFSDGVVAPAFWFLVAGLPGILVYKLVNTADSMIGYRSARYLHFGWAAARLDDLMNWVPARLTGALICLVGRAPGAWALMRTEAPRHRSPNAGWPEAAMAASLGVALAGPRVYDGRLTSDPYINAGGLRRIGAAEIGRAVALLWRVWAALLGVVAVLALVLV